MFHDRNLLRTMNDAEARVVEAVGRSSYFRDNFQTFDQATVDAAGAFLVGELERLDPMIHMPLAAVTWQRDIDLRTDVTMGDEFHSYTVTSFASAGNSTANNISWASKDQTAIARIQVDMGKVVNPLSLLAYEVAYTIPELRSAEQLGRPIDSQMLAGMTLKHQMDIDQIVYIGDSGLVINSSGTTLTGMVNNSAVTAINAAQAGATSPTGQTTSLKFIDKTPQAILTDFNTLIMTVWAATGYAVAPTKILMPPTEFAYIATQPVTISSMPIAETILDYIKKNNLLTAQMDVELDIQSTKWLDKTVRGAGSDRMVAYCQRPDFVRFPMVPLQSLQPQPNGLWIRVPYYGRAGVVEFVYPETAAYMDGIG